MQLAEKVSRGRQMGNPSLHAGIHLKDGGHTATHGIAKQIKTRKKHDNVIGSKLFISDHFK